jgi:predicted glutamine amidotransferase
MHNGQVGGFARIKREILAQLSDRAYDAIKGSTDSEVLFAVFLDELWGCEETDPLEATLRGIEAAFRRVLDAVARRGIGEHSYLNVAVADGTRAVVTRFTTASPDTAPSLYLHQGRRYVCQAGVCRMIEPDEGHGAVIVSSEPLSQDPGWHRVPANHAVLIRADGTAEMRALNVTTAQSVPLVA